MRIIVGLGNPGEKYKNNRHNVGFMVLDKLSEKNWQKSKSGFLLIKPRTFMNDSGVAVKYAVNKHKVKTTSLYVVHDDLDLRLGTWKMQLGKGPKDHGGINDIEQKLDTDNFWRIRVGVDPTTSRSGGTTRGKDYVLEDFLPEERIILNKVISEICKKLATS